MKDTLWPRQWKSWGTQLMLASWLGLGLLGPVTPVWAAEEKAIAKCVKVPGALLARGKEKTWQYVKAGDSIAAGVTLVALPLAELRSANEAVEAILLVDLGHRTPFPVLETAVTLRSHAKADLSLTLERGIILLANRKKEGAAKVQLDIRGHAMELTLREPGSKIAVEIYSRHLPGLPSLKPGKLPDPHTNLVFVALEGRVYLSTEKQGQELREPPGPAMLMWDSATKIPELKTLEKAPLKSKDPKDKENQLFQEICHCAEKLVGKDVHQALAGLVKSTQQKEREMAVVGFGAIDDLPALLDALADKDHADVRDLSILVLRHWLGRSSTQIPKLLVSLTKDNRFTKIQARTILHLLLGFTEHERTDPATFQFLISLLEHNHIAIRELGRWHLARLAPAGNNIPFDAGASPAERQRGVAAWRALIPEGQLPPRPPSPSTTKE